MSSTTTHVCEYLSYEDQWIELVHPGTQYQRRVLMSDLNKPTVKLQVVLFCPFCGEDFRSECHWQIGGRPKQNEILDRARRAGETNLTKLGQNPPNDDSRGIPEGFEIKLHCQNRCALYDTTPARVLRQVTCALRSMRKRAGMGTLEQCRPGAFPHPPHRRTNANDRIPK